MGLSITALLFVSLLVVSLTRIILQWALSIVYRFPETRQKVLSEKISLVVPAFNEEQSIASCIQSLHKMNYENFEIIIVDDGSSDRTLEIARGYESSSVKVIHQINKGKAEALNAGIKQATGSIILTVDADTRLHPEALQAMSERFSRGTSLGALAGNVKVESPKKLLQKLQDVEYATSIGIIRKAQSVLGSVMIVPGPIAALRKEAVEKAGYFSSGTFAEDFDMTLAILKAGYRAEYEDRAIAYTIAPKNIEDFLKQRRRWYRGMIQVLAKYEGMLLKKRYGAAGIYGIPYMWFDTISPMINLFLALFGVLAGYISGQWITILLGLSAYWVLQTFMVVSTVIFDRERRVWQVLASPLLVFYNTFLDGIRTAAFIEEILTLRMKWETPRR